MESEDEYVTGMSGATRTRIIQRNYAAEGDTITQLGLDVRGRVDCAFCFFVLFFFMNVELKVTPSHSWDLP